MQEYDATCLIGNFHDVSATILIDQVRFDVLYVVFYPQSFELFAMLLLWCNTSWFLTSVLVCGCFQCVWSFLKISHLTYIGLWVCWMHMMFPNMTIETLMNFAYYVWSGVLFAINLYGFVECVTYGLVCNMYIYFCLVCNVQSSCSNTKWGDKVQTSSNVVRKCETWCNLHRIGD